MGASRDFLTFFDLGSRGQTPQRTFTQNRSNDVYSRTGVPCAVNIATFHTPWSPGRLKSQNFAHFRTEIFRSIWPLTLDKCKKLTSLKLIVRVMRWYHSTKTAKMFWVTLDGATHGASISCPMLSPIWGYPKKFCCLTSIVEWYHRIDLKMSFILVSFLHLYFLFFYIT